jgi:uncharacterized protein
MKFELDAGAREARRITAYRSGEITVGGVSYRTSVLVSSEGGVEQWPPVVFEDFAEVHFEAIAVRDPEIVLVGTGARVRFPPATLLGPCSRRRIGVEFMDTGAACRSYNFLLGEGRRVIAALLPPP